MKTPTKRSAAAPRARSAHRTNIVEVASSLVGRDRDLAELAERFDAGVQLVTLIAAGGVGKSRLALRFAAQHAATYPGGAWLVDLAGARSAMDLCGAAAAVLGVRLEASGASAVEALGRAIDHRRRVLVVLDHAEHVDAAREVISAWVALAPRAHFLVASRATLEVAGEHVVRVEPLEATDAVALFLRRAGASRADFAVTDADLGVVADIARRVEGIPLAIELAAARAAVLSPTQLRARLAAPLDVLTQRSSAGRHASMRAAIGDSYAQLGQAERDTFARVSFFRGGFTLDAAEGVVGPVLASLEVLAARSLVRVVRSPRGDLRFSFYETVREFAREQLDGRLAVEVAARHCRVYAALARSTDAARELACELENLTLALDTALADDAELGLDLARGIDAALAPRGLPDQRRGVLDRAIASAGAAIDGVSGMRARVARGRVRQELGDFAGARDDLEAAMRGGASVVVAAFAAARLGEVIELGGAIDEAKELFGEALARLQGAPRSVERARVEAAARLRLGHAHRREGDLAAADAETSRAVALFAEASDAEGRAAALYESAVIALFLERYDAADARLREGLEVAVAGEMKNAEAALVTAAGSLSLERGDLDLALERHTRGVALFREIGNRYREGSALYYLARTYRVRGAPDEAMRLLDRALPIVEGARVPRYVALVEAFRATLFADAGDRARAAASLEVARAALAACATESTLTATFDLHALHVALEATTVAAARAEILAEARAIATACDDPRFARRVLELRASPPAPSSGPTLAISPGEAAFRAPDAAAWVDLTRRAPLRRILAALVRERHERPGEALGIDQIVAAGWPGERIGYAAAANRAYVALATLRKLGLRDAITRADAGYLIDPRLTVIETDDRPPSA